MKSTIKDAKNLREIGSSASGRKSNKINQVDSIN